MVNTVKDIFKKSLEICEGISRIKNDPISICVVTDMLTSLADTAIVAESAIENKITDEVQDAATELSMVLILDALKEKVTNSSNI